MSRSGYSDDFGSEDNSLWLYRQAVANAINGRRGQAFLRELAAALDAMPVKRLVADELVTADGQFCALGAVGAARGLDMSKINYDDPAAMGRAFGIARTLAAEIVFENDDDFGNYRDESPEKRWGRVRSWVAGLLVEPL